MSASSRMWCRCLILIAFFRLSNSFVFPSRVRLRPTSAQRCLRLGSPRLAMSGRSYFEAHKNIEIPLLDLRDSEYAEKIITPLPSAHLPDELRTVHLYGMELRRPVHKMLIEQAIEAGATTPSQERLYGHLVTKRDTEDLVGAIGCSSEILINALPEEPQNAGSDVGDDAPITVLCRGAFRFRVKEIKTTFPYPVAIVDELIDDTPSTKENTDVDGENVFDDDDDDDDDDDPYASLDTPELVQRTLIGIKALVDQKLGKEEISPLEQVILEDSGIDITAQKDQAEEMAAVLGVFIASLIDIAPMPVDRFFAIGMLAAELANFDNKQREEILCMTDGVARLRVVLEAVDGKVALNRAKKVAEEVTETVNEVSRDLTVGEPELPVWAKSLTDGTRLEYFWNEKYGWVGGVVVGEPMKIVDELVVTVKFDDGETHKLPFRADEKVRWRPPQ